MVSTYIYWVSTALLTLLYFGSAFMYLTKRDFVRKAQVDLGYSASHLVPFMIVVKILGPLAILSRINVPLSDLAYGGMFYHLLLSGMAHLGVRKPAGAIPAVSWYCCSPLSSLRTPCAPSLQRTCKLWVSDNHTKNQTEKWRKLWVVLMEKLPLSQVQAAA